MYELQIWGPSGSRVLQWDPRKVVEHDPTTLAALVEADLLLKGLFAESSHSKMALASNVMYPRIAAAGRWVE